MMNKINFIANIYQNKDLLGRILAMLFHWFDATAYLSDGKISKFVNLCYIFLLSFKILTDIAGNALEKLKPSYICSWLKTICKTHLEVVISCLLPHPCEYAKVGGHW